MINPAFVGRSYPSTSYVIGVEKIREFASAIGDDNPLYRDEAAGAASPYGSIIAPPTFCAIFASAPFRDAICDPEIGIDLSTLVHAEQEMTFHRVFRPGDVVITEGKIARIETKRMLCWFAVESRSVIAGKGLAVDALWTAIIRLPSSS